MLRAAVQVLALAAPAGRPTALKLRWISSTSASARMLSPPLPARVPEGAAEGLEQPELVDRYLSAEMLPLREAQRRALRDVTRDFARSPGDVGSPEVQVARLTERISFLFRHVQEHKKDFSSRRGLDRLLSQRKSFLQYLRRTDFDAYAMMIQRLGLKDNYGPTDRFSLRYKAADRATAWGAAPQAGSPNAAKSQQGRKKKKGKGGR